MIEAAHNGDIDLQTDGGWAVGDTRTITIDAFTAGGNVSVPSQSIDIAISSFDDYMSCGCVMQFDFKDAISADIRMNNEASTLGGYGASEMKITTMPALVNALPSWLKNALIEFSCLTSEGNGSSTIETVTGNKLALRSEIEVYGSVSYSKAGEGSQIPYYTVSSRRIKKRGVSGSSNFWWERSPSSAQSYCGAGWNGNANYNVASNSYLLSPFGCL